MTLLEFIGTASASIVVVLPAAYFIVKHWLEGAIKSEFDERLEKVKAELSRDSFRYSHVFQKTEEVIATVYKQIVELQFATSAFIKNLDLENMVNAEGKALLEKMVESNMTFANYYFRHRIYVPPSAMVKIEAFVDSTHKAAESYIGLIGLHAKQPDKTTEITAIVEKLKQFNKDSSKLLRELECEFQHIFGIPESQKNTD